MKIENKIYHAENGAELILRSPGPEDAEEMLRYLKTVSAETHFMIRYPEEVTYTLEEEKTILENVLNSEDSFMAAAFDGGRVAANVGINPVGTQYKMKHRASIGIAVIKEYQGQGLGKLLMETVEKKAAEMGYTQIELGVFSDNERALNLYKMLGYKPVGTIPNAFRLKDGTLIDEIRMVKG